MRFEPIPERRVPDFRAVVPETRRQISLDDFSILDFNRHALPTGHKVILPVLSSDADAENGCLLKQAAALPCPDCHSDRISMIRSLKSEEGAEDLSSSPEMQPYLDFIMAEMHGHDMEPHLRAIAQLPLEKRYVWRVASTLKSAFADFDHFTVSLDRNTLKPEDLEKLRQLLQHRPIQLCILLKALIGSQEMDLLMTEAIAASKKT